MTTKSSSGEEGLADKISATPEIKEIIRWQANAEARLSLLRMEAERNPKTAISEIEHNLNGAKAEVGIINFLRTTAINRAEAMQLKREEVAEALGRYVDSIENIERQFEKLKEQTIGRIRDRHKTARYVEEKPLEDRLFTQELGKIKDAEVLKRVRKMQLRIMVNPELGKPLSENLKDERSVNMGAYRLVYKINDNEMPVFKKYESRETVYD